MYKVLLDGTLMHDPRVKELALFEPVVELEENKAGSFSFTMPPNHPRYDDIERRKSIFEVYQDDDMVFCGMCIEVETDFFKQKKIYCEGELSYFNDSIQRPARYQGVTVRGLLEAYVTKHNEQVDENKRFTLGMVTVTDPNDYIYCYSNMETTMECLKEDLVDDLGGFFKVRHEDGIRYLDYLAESLNTNSQVIRLGVNLLDFKSNIDSSEIATAIIPLGAQLEESTVEDLETRLTIESVNDGKDYVYSEDAVERYGWIYKTVEFDAVTSPANLKRKGEQFLSETQFENVVIEASALDLHLVSDSTERFKLSDQIRVVSAPHGLDKNFRLTRQTLNLHRPENDTVTLGKNEKLSLSAKSAQVSDTIKQAVEKITPASKILQQAKSNASALINGNGQNGYVVLHENDNGVIYEILIMDTPSIDTASRMWRWNQDGFGFRAKNEQGEWQDYKVAITMDGGIVADFITTGKIQGGDSYWNLNTGELKLAGEFFNRTVDDKQALTISEGAIGLFNTLPGRPNDLNGYIASGYDPNKGMGFLAIGGARESEEANAGAIIGIYTQTEEDNWITPVISFDNAALMEHHTPFITNTKSATLFPNNTSKGLTFEHGLLRADSGGISAVTGTLFQNNGSGISLQDGLVTAWNFYAYNGTYQGMVYKDGLAAYKDSATAGISDSFGAIYGIALDPTTREVVGISYKMITVTDGLITNITDHPYYPS